MELGTLPNLVDLFDYEPYDNDWQTVDILSSFDFKQLKRNTANPIDSGRPVKKSSKID